MWRLRDKAGTHFNLKPRPLYYSLSHHSSTYGQPVTPTVQSGEGVTKLLDFHKRAGVWLWPFAFQRSLGKATQVTPHVMRISSFNQYTCSRLAGRSWKGHSFVPSRQLNLVTGYLKKKKKKAQIIHRRMWGRGRGKWNELMFLVGICLLTQRKRWLSSRIFLLLWHQLPLGFVYKSWDCQQNRTRFLLMVVNVQKASWNNRDFDISSTKTTLVLFFLAWALGLVIIARYTVRKYDNSKFWG